MKHQINEILVAKSLPACKCSDEEARRMQSWQTFNSAAICFGLQWNLSKQLAFPNNQKGMFAELLVSINQFGDLSLIVFRFHKVIEQIFFHLSAFFVVKGTFHLEALETLNIKHSQPPAR